MLHHQLPWFVGGPVLGLCVLAIRLLLNQRLGVTGGYASLVEAVGHRSVALDWRAFFFIGIVLGGLVFALVAGGPDFHGYGWLTDTFTGSTEWLVGALLVVAGVLIGFGAQAAQGCTSGNGLAGCSMTSPASFAATATFFSVAIAVSFLIEAVI